MLLRTLGMKGEVNYIGYKSWVRRLGSSRPVWVCNEILRKLFSLGRARRITIEVHDTPGPSRVPFSAEFRFGKEYFPKNLETGKKYCVGIALSRWVGRLVNKFPRKRYYVQVVIEE